ncbi:hypothetical protein COUCH_20470 [Couchioplanes caeruleus]|uniref:hypothetical protein n=1 Tax=Couchioplanes caeruleus TaxID=56438 RepID=UPI0020BEFDA6|nr:hypothetical protein [Couchioplanes caeruleus]UQU61438.1 hypothetical protein COUCH_20470 [Couchioplanes caeruleus]
MSRLGRTRRALLAIALTTAILGAGYLGSVAIRRTRTVTMQAATGTYRVGRRMTEWTDDTRADPLAPSPGARELAVWLWYPAPPDATGPRARYAPGAWAALHLPGVAGWGESSFDAVRVHALDSAPVAAGRFPVVVLEPGLGLAAPQYTAIAENLAAHGWLVAGVTPTYSANVTVLHGKVVQASAAGNPAVLDQADLHAPAVARAADALLRVWAADARFVAARVAALDRDGWAAGHVDATRTVYAGHSFGGAASLQACHDDPRCAAAVDLDGTQFGPVVHTGLRRPVLLIAAGSCITGTCRPASAADRADQVTARTLLAASTGPVRTYEVDGMRHFDFTDYDAYYLAAPLHRLLPLGSLPRGRGLSITNDHLISFLAG